MGGSPKVWGAGRGQLGGASPSAMGPKELKCCSSPCSSVSKLSPPTKSFPSSAAMPGWGHVCDVTRCSPTPPDDVRTWGGGGGESRLQAREILTLQIC